MVFHSYRRFWAKPTKNLSNSVCLGGELIEGYTNSVLNGLLPSRKCAFSVSI